jgi:small subunit ribosomal protein S21
MKEATSVGFSGCTVVPEPFDGIDATLRKFKRMTYKSGLDRDVRRHAYYEPPSRRKKIKSLAARKRAAN